jgi:hypothetical protein
MKNALWLLPSEAAELLGITASGARWLVDTRQVRSTRTATGRRLISAVDVERLRRERERNPPQSPARRE